MKAKILAAFSAFGISESGLRELTGLGLDRLGEDDLMAVLSGATPRHPVHLVPQKEMQP